MVKESIREDSTQFRVYFEVLDKMTEIHDI